LLAFSGSATKPAISSGLIFISGNRRNRSAAKRSLTVASTIRSAPSMSSPRCEACRSAIGLRTRVSRETSQSMAFLRPPGSERTYSGLEMRRPSAASTRAI